MLCRLTDKMQKLYRDGQAVDDNTFEVLSHPPYSPDLALSDFHFFPHLKRDLKGTHFTSDDEVKQA
jgi:histone-lysine N-methyltransferase SETMAR